MIAGILRRALIVIAIAAGTKVSAQAQFTVNSPTTDWQVVPYKPGLVTDYPSDQQTGSGEADIVGGGILPSFYTKFIAGTTATNGTAYFRVRLGADDSPAGFKGACFLGVDANNDGKLDVFYGVDNSGSSNGIFVWKAGTGANISPSTTSISSSTPSFTYAQTTTNYSWRMVDAVIDPAADTAAKLNTDNRTGTGQTDYFISFSLPFADIVAACAQVGVSGVTSATTLRYVVGTATQANAFNQDLNGVQGGVNSSSTWESLGAISLPLNVTGQVVNAVPVAANDSSTTNEDTAVTLSVLANDTDADGDALTVSAVTQSANGTVTFTSTGVTFTPAQNYFGSTSFTYTISDGKGGTATATVSVTVNSVNDAPVAANDTATTAEDAAVDISVITNDSDVDGDTLAVASVTQPANGIVTFTATGVRFTPAANFYGATSFTYTISDGKGGAATGTVNVTVTPVNDAPVASNDTLTTNEDTPKTFNVLANDSDVDGDSLVITGVTQPIGGSVTFTAANVTFSPNANFSGTTSFSYTISDGHGGTATALVNVTVAAVNDAPIAQADVANTNEDTAVLIPVLVNDSDIDGDSLAVQSVTQSADGAVTFTATGVQFTPATNFYGTATFNYTITDGNGGTATATVTVTVNAVNDAPVAVADTASTDEDADVTIPVLANDSDPDGDSVVIQSVTQSANGTVAISGTGVKFSPVAEFHGTATFSYTISDGNGGTATAIVTVTVNAVNDAPMAQADSATTDEDSAVTIPVLLNDSDIDGDNLAVVSVTQSQDGVVTFTSAGVTFTPAANFHGPTSFSYTISDGKGATASAAVSVTVNPVNDAPIAQADAATTEEDAAVTIPVLANDSDADGDTLVVESVTQSPEGTTTFNASGVTFTPKANFHGTATFTYTVVDAQGGIAIATVTVTVTAVNDAPVAHADSATTEEDTAVTIPVLANDSDVDGDTLVIDSVTQSQDGVVSFTASNVTFTPAANFTGNTTFSYTVTDGKGGTATAVVSVAVSSTNDAPVAQADVAATDEDTAVIIPVLGNDSDADGDALIVESVTQSADGTVAFTPANVTFTPAADFHGTATFTYTVSDGKGGTAIAAVTVTVNPVNDAPVAKADNAVTEEDSVVTIPVLANDTDVDGDALAVTAVTQSQDGVVTFTSSGVTFTPSINFSGTTTFTYTVSDGKGGTAVANVSVNVRDVNDAPLALADTATTDEDSPVTIPVLANDTDIDGDTLAIESVTQSSNGVVTFTPSGVSFTPASNFHGSATFTYTVADGKAGTAIATVTVTVNAVNDAPIAQDDVVTTNKNVAITIPVLANDSDIDGDSLTIQSVTQQTGGTVSFNAATVIFTPAANFHGATNFTYTISDGKGASATATVFVTVANTNSSPVAADDFQEGTEDVPVIVNVLANDTDPDGDTLAVTSAVLVSGQGTLRLNGDGTVTFVPARDFNGTAKFTYVLSDGNGGSTSGSGTIQLKAVNDLPIAVNDTASTPQERPVTINVLSNDSDVETAALTVRSVQLQSGAGTVTITAESEVQFVPAVGFIGAALLNYVVEDADGGTATAFITIDVNGLPIANADYVTTQPNQPVTLNVLANDLDPEGLALIVTEATIDPLLGAFTIGSNGEVTYAPTVGLTGAITGEYAVRDAAGNVSKARIYITIAQNPPPSPIALPDTAETEFGTAVTVNVLKNDSDPTGSALTVVSLEVDPVAGSAVINPDGTITFTPAKGFQGAASLAYTVRNATGQVSASTLLVTVLAERAAPIAMPDLATAIAGTIKDIAVLANDVEPNGGALTLVSVAVTSGSGEATIANGNVQFVAPSTPQVVTLTYTVRNGSGVTASTTITVTVLAATTNSAPIAVNDTARTPVGTPVELNLLVNDQDPDGDSLVLTGAVVSAQQGTVQFTPAGVVNFIPAVGFNDIAVITYTISDGNNGTATGTFTVNVNDNPIAVTDFTTTLPAAAVTVRVLANDTDPNGNVLSVVAATVDSLQGSVTIGNDGALVFTPVAGFTGTAQLSYTIVDGKGDTAEGTVYVVVNTPPVATVDTVSTLIGEPVTIAVLANDTDAESDNLTIAGATVDPAQGTVVVNPDGTITFTPASTFTGTATISYVLVDSMGAATTGTVLVNRENAAPTAESRRVYTYCETPVIVNPLRTAADIDGDALRVVQIGKASKGTVKQRADGMLVYTPNRNFSGKVEDSFTVVLSDSNGSLVETVIQVSAFSAIAGRFEGLLVDRNQEAGTRAPDFRGRITVNLAGRATFSAKVHIDGKTQSLVGSLSGALSFERKIRIDGRQMLLSLKYDDLNDRWNARVTGSEREFVNGTAISRVSSSKRDLAGRYSAQLLEDGVDAARNAGAAEIRIRKSGAVTIVGYLPDGKAFSDSPLVTGEWNLSLYTRGLTGVLKGAASETVNPITGTLLWKTSPESRPLEVTSSPVAK